MHRGTRTPDPEAPYSANPVLIARLQRYPCPPPPLFTKYQVDAVHVHAKEPRAHPPSTPYRAFRDCRLAVGGRETKAPAWHKERLAPTVPHLLPDSSTYRGITGAARSPIQLHNLMHVPYNDLRRPGHSTVGRGSCSRLCTGHIGFKSTPTLHLTSYFVDSHFKLAPSAHPPLSSRHILGTAFPRNLVSSESLLPTIAFASLLASSPHCSLPHPLHASLYNNKSYDLMQGSTSSGPIRIRHLIQ
ncbi:hypothetical protein DFH08DRAFT_970842 [Mycena albidolilacea]|uniref:Uncharacterized protein n=1 Tax=Mycena albidolilacea TaxID=1033008 RepID=A0AAD6ZEG6_9AGAR|nr:hypothetical protein DFH08DRAFT_970842 [Mycena albidolilacea]